MKRAALLLAIAAIGCIAAIATVALAGPRRRLVVVTDDVRWLHAIEAAVEPWDIDVTSVSEPAPPDEAAAAALAAREHGDAVAWTASGALWLYDAREGRLDSRQLSHGAPFDDATAAAAALSLKTLLRLSALAPSAPEEASSIVPPWEIRSSAPSASSAASVAPPQRTAPARRARAAAVEFDLGARFAETDAAIAEPRLTLAAGYWVDRFGLFASISAGPGVAVSRAGLSGTFFDFGVALLVRARVGGERLLWIPGVGIGAHVELLDAVTQSGPANVLRLDPAVEIDSVLAYAFSSRAFVGVHLATSLMLRRQQVFVDDVPALTASPVTGEVGLRAGVLFR